MQECEKTAGRAPHPWLGRLLAQSQGHRIWLCHKVYHHGQKVLRGLPGSGGAGQEGTTEILRAVSVAGVSCELQGPGSRGRGSRAAGPAHPSTATDLVCRMCTFVIAGPSCRQPRSAPCPPAAPWVFYAGSRRTDRSVYLSIG